MEFSWNSVYWILIFLHFFLYSSESANLRCYRGSITEYEDAPLEKPYPLIYSSNPCVDVTKCSLFFVFGIGGNATSYAVTVIIPAFIRYGKCNVLLLDWTKEAAGAAREYLMVVANAKIVGEKFADSLLKLLDMELNKDIHIFGHSLGAHLVGYAGRQTIRRGYTLPWITVFDPARPFLDPDLVPRPVDDSSAAFVDAIHCDPGGNGMDSPVGHVDLWPNYGEFVNGNKLQPGCTKTYGVQDLITGGNSCSHNFCLNLYSSSLVDPTILEGGYAENYQAWVRAGANANRKTNYIGLSVIKENEGNFYMKTTGVYPYGEGKEGVIA